MSGGITLSTVAAGLGAAASLYTLAGGGKSKESSPAPAPLPPPPVVTEPTKVPVAKDTGKAAERASLAEQMRRRGRASTILTDTGASDTLGV